MTRRSIFLKNESWNDVQSVLGKANTEEEYRHMMSERAKSHGWTKEDEISYQSNLRTCGFATAFQRPKENPLGKNPEGRANARLLSDALRNDFRQGKITGEVEE
ncbi:MAG: hypothetical protein NUV80_02715 [Candidatus Berkelbacteria bacterium]|nr:hypothetical protein [Candidatus Berkelbacteria bacterium]